MSALTFQTYGNALAISLEDLGRTLESPCWRFGIACKFQSYDLQGSHFCCRLTSHCRRLRSYCRPQFLFPYNIYLPLYFTFSRRSCDRFLSDIVYISSWIVAYTRLRTVVVPIFSPPLPTSEAVVYISNALPSQRKSESAQPGTLHLLFMVSYCPI